MDILEDTFITTGTLHHAYVVLGDTTKSVATLEKFLSEVVRLKIHSNPDVRNIKSDTFSIDNARTLSLSQEMKDFAGSRKIFIIETSFITEEAQNALLKVFEEPTAGTHFFICIPQDTLLPTLRSRVQVIVQNTDTGNVPSILKLGFKDRLALVKEITEGISDEEKTKQDAIVLLNHIEKELHDMGVEKNVDSLRTTETARTALYDRGAPIKIILEHVMIQV